MLGLCIAWKLKTFPSDQMLLNQPGEGTEHKDSDGILAFSSSMKWQVKEMLSDYSSISVWASSKPELIVKFDSYSVPHLK